LTPARLQRLPDDGDDTTVTRTARGSRKHARCRRSFPGEGEGDGWNGYGRWCASAVGRLHCFVADTVKKISQGGAPEENKRERRE
jgi:hypothetical protein